MHTRITARQFCELQGKDPDTIRMRFAKLRKTNPSVFPDSWQIDGELSEAQVSALIEAGKRKGGAITPAIDTDYKGVPVKGEILKEARPNEVAPTLEVNSEEKTRRWPLWVALIITAGASIPNMVEVTTAIKGSNLVAWAMTGVFTLIPGLLIAARLRGFLWGSVVVGVMGYTAFCNASAIFGGLTALDKGFVLQPTVFLEAVTNMMNTPYLETARALSALMALLIGAIEYVAFKNLSK